MIDLVGGEVMLGEATESSNLARWKSGVEGHLGKRLSKMFKRSLEEHSDVEPDQAGDTPTRWVAL